MFQAAILGTISIVLVWIYFYMVYRERYLGFWLISWLIFFGRIIAFDLAPPTWKQSLFGFTIFQSTFFICGLFFLHGTYLLIDKKLPKYWVYCGVASSIFSFLFTLLQFPMVYKLLFPALYGSAILIYIGKIFICDLKIKGLGNYISGYAFIGWGLITIFMSYTLDIPWLTYWAHLLSGYLRLAIAIGTTVVYVEKSRSDLATKEAQYRLLTENAIDVIYRYRLLPVPHYEYISPSVLSITGYSPEEYYANAKLMVSLIHPEDATLFTNIMTPSLAPSVEMPLTIRLNRKDGSTIWIEHKGVVIRNKDGTPLELEGIIRDVTIRKDMEKLMGLTENMKMVGKMAVCVAHEIRNPLTSVRGFLQIMERTANRSADKERYSFMIEELDHTNEIISEYLLMSESKVSNLVLCDLNSIINSLLPLLQASAAAYSITVKLALESLPPLLLDKNEIKQLLFNLANNGLEATPKGGELVIRTFCEQDRIILAITDTGPGISPSILENIGTPFLSTKDSGTGLGLPICFRIASRHNATIHVETNASGTTFFVHFKQPLPTT
jgi:PAS domain S-box-containing protein